MKKSILLLISLCLVITSCKDNDAPKSEEEIKECAFEVVENFIEDLYEDDLDIGELCSTHINRSNDLDILSEYNLPSKISAAAREQNIKLDPKKVSFCSKIEKIKDKNRLSYAVVKIKYKGKEIRFLVRFRGFNNDGKTGTEGNAIILTTIGLVKFNNNSFSNKSGFVLECDPGTDDMTPYDCYPDAIEAYRLVTKQKKVSPDKVKIHGSLLSDMEIYYDVVCGDSISFTVRSNRITKISKK